MTKLKYIILVIILLLGFFVRHHNIYTWPRTGATFDEYAWTWLGMNLIQHQVPISWSPHPQYTKRTQVIYQKAYFLIVNPYLEHPPLFGLVAGGYALLTGTKDMFHVNINHIRGLALILGTLSIGMVYLLTTELYGSPLGLLASFLYAITPTVVIGSRIVQNENFFIPFFLLSLFFTSRYIKTKKTRYRNTAAIICGLLTLAKVPWIAAAFAIAIIFVYLKKYRDAGKFLAIVLPIFSLFFFYGIYFDANLFFKLWQLQLHRYDLAFGSFFALFTSPYLVDRFLIDGWIYFGWIAIMLVFTKDLRKHYFIIFPFLAYLLIFIAGIPNEAGHGWYRYPLYPFMTIATTLFLKDYFNKNLLLTFIFLIFIGLSMLNLVWTQVFGFSFFFFRFFIILFSSSMLPLFIPKTKNLSFTINYLCFIFIIFLSIWTTRQYNEQ